MSKFYPLVVSRVVRETPDAVTVYFEISDSDRDVFKFDSGQYLTLRFRINDNEERRSYSLCSTPDNTLLAVNVKRVKKGKVSNYINDQITSGDVIDVMPPEGRFVIDINPDSRRQHFFVAAGSGITPIISMIKSVLEHEPQSTCHLYYGNRNEESIIFKNELDQLQQKYSGQLTINHILSQPTRQKSKGLKGLFSKGTTSWQGETGRIDSAHLDGFLNQHALSDIETHYYICGPGAMIDTIINHLEKKGVASDYLHTERFTSMGSPTGQGIESRITVEMDGQRVEVVVPADKTILDALIDAGYDPPYSCTSGACSTCVARVKHGEVTMDACYALDDAEVNAGFILTCQARPQTEVMEISIEN